jgi:hypothetical protein
MDVMNVDGMINIIVRPAEGRRERIRMQRLVYTVDIDEEIYGADCLLEAIDATIKSEIGCKVLRSRLESPDEVCENGEWEDEEG